MQYFLVGGAVRDRLLGYPYSERDWVVVGATPQEMLDAGFRPVGRDFPVFLHPETQEEYALARTERKSGHGYRGFSIHADPSVTLEEDLARRDLTINAIAAAPDGQILDPYGGRHDIEQRLLRHVGPAFVEDPLRILRVARFASRYAHLGFTVAAETGELMQEIVASGEVAHLAAERVWKELERALGERSPQVFFEVLYDCGALEVWMPELRMVGEPAWRSLTATGLTEPPVATPERFGVLMTDLNSTAADALCQRLKAPNEVRDLARLVATAVTAISTEAEGHALAKPGSATQILEILETADSWRRPDRLSRLITTLSLRYFDGPWPRLLQAARERCAAIDHRALVASGLTGKEIGTALRKQRLSAIEEVLNDR